MSEWSAVPGDPHTWRLEIVPGFLYALARNDHWWLKSVGKRNSWHGNATSLTHAMNMAETEARCYANAILSITCRGSGRFVCCSKHGADEVGTGGPSRPPQANQGGG